MQLCALCSLQYAWISVINVCYELWTEILCCNRCKSTNATAQNKRRKLHLRFLLLMCFSKKFSSFGNSHCVCVVANIVWQCSVFYVSFATFLWWVWQNHWNDGFLRWENPKSIAQDETVLDMQRYFPEQFIKPIFLQCHFKWIGSVGAITVSSFLFIEEK